MMRKLNLFFFDEETIPLTDWLLFYGVFIFTGTVSLLTYMVVNF